MRPVLALPTLSPRLLWPSAPSPRSLFPLPDPRSEYFYLGRAAVHLSVRRLGLAGTEVLVPAYHHGVEVAALEAAGAKPVFYGLGADLRVDRASLTEAWTPRCRGLYVIHVAGFPQPMAELLAFARENRLKVVEDCALALFSSEGAIPVGMRGDAAIFCLYKTLPVPHGGALWMPGDHERPVLRTPPTSTLAHQFASALATRSSLSGEAGRLWRSGMTRLARGWRRRGRLPVDDLPVGGRAFLPGQERLGASALVPALARRIDAVDVIQRRRENFRGLQDRLTGAHEGLPVTLADGTCPLFFPLLTPSPERVAEALQRAGVETVAFWREGSPRVDLSRFPTVARLRRTVLELPIHQDLGPEALDRMAEVVRPLLIRRGPRTPPSEASARRPA